MYDDRAFGFATRALHAGTPPDPATGARAVPIYQTAAYVFGSTEEAAELFALRSYGHIYSRISNPTVAAFEERMASLEGGLGAVAFSSGLAAQLCTVLALAQAGDHIVCTQSVYGGTITQLSVTIKRMGIETTFVPVDDFGAMREAIGPQTRFLFAETVGNPSGIVADIGALAELAHGCGIPLVIDNTFATPYLCRPMERGADIVVHSATKFLNGHGTAIGGVMVESGKFPWGSGRFPLLSQPSPGYQQKVFTETFGEYAFLMRARAEVLRDVGAQMSPMDAWLLLLGLETLPLRMERHVENAAAVIAFLKKRAEVAWVREPQMGSIFTFGLRGGREAGRRFIDTLQLWSHLANVGDSKSLVIHPASTTHSQLSDDELRRAGVEPESVRLSVGLEDVADLTWDLDNALRAAVRA
ncbi:MAG TPA: O-acetylhomoserine aminocarboxypropyltransferase/cysteine synthase family protein, partial [Candidatus Baltobacteraceae bacterium]|jgi:O-acetylhomoserine (thiol)-lyase|nr:O-acetylhomoserine aminocarboxypropyltransferase/cysteine synthase family protein [Candidatus Baltobacteraceae bacterium]